MLAEIAMQLGQLADVILRTFGAITLIPLVVLIMFGFVIVCALKK